MEKFKNRFYSDQMPAYFNETNLGIKILHALNQWRKSHESQSKSFTKEMVDAIGIEEYLNENIANIYDKILKAYKEIGNKNLDDNSDSKSLEKQIRNIMNEILLNSSIVNPWNLKNAVDGINEKNNINKIINMAILSFLKNIASQNKEIWDKYIEVNELLNNLIKKDPIFSKLFI